MVSAWAAGHDRHESDASCPECEGNKTMPAQAASRSLSLKKKVMACLAPSELCSCDVSLKHSINIKTSSPMKGNQGTARYSLSRLQLFRGLLVATAGVTSSATDWQLIFVCGLAMLCTFSPLTLFCLAEAMMEGNGRTNWQTWGPVKLSVHKMTCVIYLIHGSLQYLDRTFLLLPSIAVSYK